MIAMMKVICLCLFYLCFFHLPLNAQSTFGVKGGLNAAWMGIENEKLRFGFHAGAYGSLDLGKAALLQAELMYSQKGSNFNKVLPYDIPLFYTYHYLSLPVMIGFKLGENVVLQIGPEVSYLLSANILFDENVIKAREVFPDFDLGVLAGIQIVITDQIDLQLRYVHGFTEMPTFGFTDMNGSSIGAIVDGKNRVFQAGVTYRLSKDSQLPD
jgi:hypothetical protein